MKSEHWTNFAATMLKKQTKNAEMLTGKRGGGCWIDAGSASPF